MLVVMYGACMCLLPYILRVCPCCRTLCYVLAVVHGAGMWLLSCIVRACVYGCVYMQGRKAIGVCVYGRMDVWVYMCMCLVAFARACMTAYVFGCTSVQVYKSMCVYETICFECECECVRECVCASE